MTKQRFRVFVNDHDSGVFILDGADPMSSDRWMGVGFKTMSSMETRRRYAEYICELLNRGADTSNSCEHGQSLGSYCGECPSDVAEA